MTTVAALYVDPKGPYVGMEGVDAWTEDRDARMYPGPGPCVLHPTCGPWSRLKAHSKHQDPTLGPIAVAQCRAYGGVLEHPADSSLWKHCDLPRPEERLFDPWDGFTVSVRQVDWGHRAAKPTWLYICGVPYGAVDPRRPARTPTAKITNNDRPGMKDLERLSALEARLTPLEFAEWLVSIARMVER